MSESPKTFISYSWTTPEHEEWVLQLATRLVENGIDVILDKWYLREGADKYVFMEKMVTDPDVKKVIMVCDKAYAEKADKRKGGVGTETQVISGEIYAKVEDNKKFVPIIREKDEKENPYLPTYLKSRIFIDMSDEELETRNFEQLLRWAFDKPIYQKPELGKPPAYIFEENSISLGTNSKYRIALESIKQNKSNIVGTVRDYFETFAENIFQLKIEPEENVNLDDKVLESIESFIPYRDEVIGLILYIAKYSTNQDVYREIHRFFEFLVPFTFPKPTDKNSWIEGEQDNFLFITQELFLYTIAIFLKYEKFSEVRNLLSQKYYSQTLADMRDIEQNIFNYTVFNTYLKTLEYRKKRLQDNSYSLMANLLKERANRKDINLEDILQADFILYLYSLLHLENHFFRAYSWFPHTAILATYRKPFEVFARAQSSRYFEQMKKSLDIETKDDLAKLAEKCKKEEGYVPIWGFGFETIDVPYLMNIDKVATLP